jgi:small subunit ribosomal protein S21
MKKYPYNKNKKKNWSRTKSWTAPAYLSDYEKSVWFLNSFTGKCVKKRENESTENMLRRFKRSVENSGILREMKRREYYMSKSQKRRDKMKRALKRLRKRLKFEQMLSEKEDIKPGRYVTHLPGERVPVVAIW